VKCVIWILAVIALLGGVAFLWNDDLSTYVRYDRFDIHLSMFRVLVASATIGASVYLIRTYCFPLFTGLLLPTKTVMRSGFYLEL